MQNTSSSLHCHDCWKFQSCYRNRCSYTNVQHSSYSCTVIQQEDVAEIIGICWILLYVWPHHFNGDVYRMNALLIFFSLPCIVSFSVTSNHTHNYGCHHDRRVDLKEEFWSILELTEYIPSAADHNGALYYNQWHGINLDTGHLMPFHADRSPWASRVIV